MGGGDDAYLHLILDGILRSIAEHAVESKPDGQQQDSTIAGNAPSSESSDPPSNTAKGLIVP